MNKVILMVLGLLIASFHSTVFAADNAHYLSIKEAMSSQTFKDRLNPQVSFHFGDQRHAKPSKVHGQWVSNKKTRAAGRSAKEACEWVLLSALLSLQDRALAEGGNAVVNIQSYYKKNTFSSAEQYECHTGKIIAGVALRGTVVSLP